MCFILLVATFVALQYIGKALLIFDGKSGYANAPQCFVIRTLLNLF
jgi:hypothetical protein